MTDIPQEVREAAAGIYQRFRDHDMSRWVLNGRADTDSVVQAIHAMFIAGKRAGMERAAEIAEEDDKLCDCHAHSESECACGAWWGSKQVSPLAIAQAIRIETHG